MTQETTAVETAATTDAPARRTRKPRSDKGVKKGARKAAAKKTAAKKAPAARKKAAPKNAAEGGIIAADYRSQYEKSGVKTAGGNQSLDNGDKVAKMLRGKSLDEVTSIVAKALGVTAKSLAEQYAHLNVGMQRMNLGNRLRKALA